MMIFRRFSLRHVVVSLAMAAVILVLGVYDVSAQKPGTRKWTFTSKANFCSPVALGPKGTVYVTTLLERGSRGSLIALNAKGKMRWEVQFKCRNRVIAAPVVSTDGTVYVISEAGVIASNNGILYAVRPTGKIQWELPIRGLARELALGHDGTIYVFAEAASQEPTSLVAIRPDGTKKWTLNSPSIRTDSFAKNSLLVGPNGTIYVSGRHGEVLAINPDRTLKAKFPGYLTTGGAIDWDGTLYLNMARQHTNTGREFCARKSDGTEAWRYTTGPRTVPVIGPNGTVYVVNTRGRLYAFRRDGTKLWETSGNWAVRHGSTPNVYPAVGSDGTVYLATGRGRLYAFSSTGAKKWEAKLGFGWPVIGPDGTVYVRTYNVRHPRAMVVAVHTGCRGPAASAWPMTRQNAQNTARAPAARNARGIPKPDLPINRQNTPTTARAPTVLNAPVIPKPDLSNKDAYSVDHVVDGDTFVVAGSQTKTGTPKITVRLIGVDAPQAVERYGKEAGAFLTKLLKGKKVCILWEGWKPTKDNDGRLFAYAYRAPDGLFINAEIIRRGYGRVHKPFSFKHEKVFRQLEGIARNSKKGLWASTARQ